MTVITGITKTTGITRMMRDNLDDKGAWYDWDEKDD